jgi:glycosyltransferase involved in cell wall biosynthesis
MSEVDRSLSLNPLNIVALSPNSWDAQWVNRQQLLSRIGRHHHVIYSNGAWSVWDRATPGWRSSPLWGGFVSHDNVVVDLPPRLTVRWPRVAVWDRMAINYQCRRLRRCFGKSAPLVAYICHPMFEPYVNALKPDYVVYHCYDMYEHQPGWTLELDASERILLKRADLVFSPTTMISDELMRKVTCQARVLPNAADVQAIFTALNQGIREPDDLVRIPKPRIGYLGSIHPQVDLDLIAELARRRPQWHFVLIGPEQKVDVLHSSAGYRMCCSLPNVHFLGEKHRSEVPAYLVHMNVNALFYSMSQDSWTHMAYPLKLHEYLACGHPVVSSDLKMIREFSPLITFASGPDEWERALNSAIDDDSPGNPELRRAIAAPHNWDARADVLNSWLNSLPRLHNLRLASESSVRRTN